jgi:hypothetical protein
MADAQTLGATYSRPKVGRVPSPWSTHPTPLTTGRATPQHRWRGLRFAPPQTPKNAPEFISCFWRMIPDDIGVVRLVHQALSGWGYADFHAGVNFRFTEFSQVRSV